ncbi:MAG: hypothetical protein OEL87_03560 [Nanoarchaeota archaeon]|nr:hypothetical protein [Nanoarchaeota archaeon]
MVEDIEKICANYIASRVQRAEEIARGEGISGTSGFENIGCYECDGGNEGCSRYIFIEALMPALRKYEEGLK